MEDVDSKEWRECRDSYSKFEAMKESMLLRMERDLVKGHEKVPVRWKV